MHILILWKVINIKFNYNVINNSVVIVGIENPESVINIPKTIENLPVTRIKGPLLRNIQRSIVTEITIPETVKVLDEYAIYDLHYLKKLNLNQGLKEIKRFGIYTCPDLKEIDIPDSVEYIEEFSIGYMYEHGRAYKFRYITFVCSEGSSGYQYALKNNFSIKKRIRAKKLCQYCNNQ